MHCSNVIRLIHLPRGAQPKRSDHAARLEEVEDVRLMQCPRYNSCLNLAARRNWVGFHCGNCPFYAEHQAALSQQASGS